MTRRAIQPSRRIQQRSFGYQPTGALKVDLRQRATGLPNVLKRLQSPTLVREIDPRPGDRLLDVGCGSGYITHELAKRVAVAVGVDPGRPFLSPHLAPDRPRPRFIQGSADALPFDDGAFDVVLASEVLPMTENPALFVTEIRRVLRPCGRLVVLNGTGHPAIEQAYQRQSWLLRVVRRAWPERTPPTFADYAGELQRAFGTSRTAFLDERDTVTLLEDNGFMVNRSVHTPGMWAGALHSWYQFVSYVRHGDALGHARFHRFMLLALPLHLLSRRGYPGGMLLVATRTD